MRRFIVLIIVLAASSLGCAAVFKGSTQEVKFTAVPEGSDVRVDGRYLGATPTSGELNRNQSQNVLVSKDGFVEQHVQIQRKPDTPWWFWDIGTCVVPIMLCIPLLVDGISGAWMSLDDEIRIKLEPKPSSPVSLPSPSPAASSSSGIGY